MKINNLMQGVEYSHWILDQQIEKGDLVVDATVGNGHDTLYLAELVGDEGRVVGFDIQKSAIEETKKRLNDSEIKIEIELVHEGHEKISNYIDTKVERPKGILFNLGYLPGGDKEIITKAKTTIKALKEGLNLLKIDGIIVLVIYPGHAGGKKEKKAILDYAASLDQKKFNVLHYYYLNQANKPPEVMVIKKRK